MPLSKTALKEIDPDILQVIIDMNTLPFVKQTLFSCAATGKSLMGSHSSVAYVVIEYDLTLLDMALPFHVAMTQHFPESKQFFHPRYSDKRMVLSYYAKMGKAKQAWDGVREMLKAPRRKKR